MVVSSSASLDRIELVAAGPGFVQRPHAVGPVDQEGANAEFVGQPFERVIVRLLQPGLDVLLAAELVRLGPLGDGLGFDFDRLGQVLALDVGHFVLDRHAVGAVEQHPQRRRGLLVSFTVSTGSARITSSRPSSSARSTARKARVRWRLVGW